MTDLTLEDLLDEGPSFKPTAEQEAILKAGRGTKTNLMLTAYAGASKSTTLNLLARVLPKVSTCYVVFNKKNQLEAEKAFKDNSKFGFLGSASHVDIVTANAMGHRAWSTAIGKRLIVDTKKIFNIVKQTCQSERANPTRDEFAFIMQLVNKARQTGLLKDASDDQWQDLADSLYGDLSEDHIYLARKSLAESVRQAYSGLIDFDDQIYMSAMFGGVFRRFECVMVDESQDLSPLNHKQIARTAAARLICVGDSRQAIYAFRGADSSSMDSLRSLRDEWIDLPLSTTFRCPKVIVARQQQHAPGFTAYETNQEGQFLDWTQKEWKIEELPGRIAILCRNNAPLFSCALRLIRKGIGCTLLGSEIGKGLVTLSRKIAPNDSLPRDDALVMVRRWQEDETSKALANGKDEKVGLIEDKAECLCAVIAESKTIGEARRLLETMFSKENLRITLSTGHKAKGLEWPTVIHLDPWRIPSKWAKDAANNGNPVPMEQDMNLRYVIETRAQECLILANMDMLQ